MFRIVAAVFISFLFHGSLFGFAGGAGTCEVVADFSTITAMTSRPRNFTPGPYVVTADVPEYQPGVPVELTLTGPTFTGVMFSVVNEAGVAVGTFDPDGGTRNCDGTGMSITHTSNFGNNMSTTLTWIPPAQSQGTVFVLGYVLSGVRGMISSQQFYRFVRDDNSALEIPAADNVAPNTVLDEFATDEDTPLTGNPNVLDNDSDADGGPDPLTVTAFDALSALGATVNIQANGDLSYDPSVSAGLNTLANGVQMVDNFQYTVSDGEDTAIGTVQVTVTGVNDAPTAQNLADQSFFPNEIVSIDAAAAFSDVDSGDTLVFAQTGLPASLQIDPDTGEITGVTTLADANGSPFTVMVTATDGGGEMVSSSFQLEVSEDGVFRSGFEPI